jgi:methylmalonyl-CoA mutase N-terminal domain/subunit
MSSSKPPETREIPQETAASSRLGTDGIATAEARWEEAALKPALKKMPEKLESFETISGIPVERVYTPLNSRTNYLEKLGFPGEYPFTRGIQPTMYRARDWTRRQVVGTGSAEQTNLRHKYVLSMGQTGLSNDFDIPTCIGMDSDDPRAEGEVARVGVTIDTQQDMCALFAGIPMDQVSTSLTINGPAIVLLSMYIVAAEQRGISPALLRGTTQNDPLKEFYAQKSFSIPPNPSVRIVGDIVEHCSRHLPRWNTVSLCGYQTRDTGGRVEHELAFTFATGITYIEEVLRRGIEIDDFAPRLSFLFYIHNDFFEEIAKFRAARRIWARILKGRFRATNPESMKLRVHAQTGATTLTYQQPEVNLMRGAIQALAGVLGGVQSMALSTYDEAFSIPSEKAQRLALRTQQVIAHETGVTDTVDPLGGSFYVERLTDQIEERVWDWMQRIESMGGMVPLVENGYIERVLSEEAYRFQTSIQNKKRIVVGVNDYKMDDEFPEEEIFRVDPEVETAIVEKLRRYKRERDQDRVKRHLDLIRETARGSSNLMPVVIQAVRDGCTEGEIMGALEGVFGCFQQTRVF